MTTFPVGGGMLGEMIRRHDWSQTSLGPIAQWSGPLRTATDIVLQAPMPMVMLWGPDGVMIYNDAYSEFAGARHPRLLGSRVLEGWPEVADFNAEVMAVGLKGGTLSFRNHELTLHRNDVPEQVWMDLNYGPVLDETGKPAGVLAVVVETTAQVRAERHLTLMVNELNHRVKNTLSMIQAISAQTFRSADDLEQAQASFSSRIVALAKASDLLTGENWEGAALDEIVARAAQATAPERFLAQGPAVRLSPKTALSLSMAMHELTTNAVKYGALSNDTGRVRVDWSIAADPRGDRLRLAWREEGGPPVTPPARRGFGSRLIERGLAAELGGEVTVSFEPGGVLCAVDAPLNVYGDGA